MSDDTATKKLENILGLEVKVLNILDMETVGTVYSYNSQPSSLIIQVPSQTAVGASYNYKVLRTSNIKSLEVLSKNIDHKNIPKLLEIDSTQIPQIIKRNTETVDLKRKTQNEKATKEGQTIFNAVYKTMPNVRWKGVSIIVLDEVQIDPPYGLDAVKSIIPNRDPDENDAIKLVKKIVDGVWQKFESEQKGG